MHLRALSIGEAVPRDNFDAVIHSAFDTAVNLRLVETDRLITVLISQGYELPQGIRIWMKDLSLQILTPGLSAAARGGILRFDSAHLSVDLRGAPIWKCRIPELRLDMSSPVAQQAWSLGWSLLDQEQQRRNTELRASALFQSNAGAALTRRISQPIRSLMSSSNEFDVLGAMHAAQKMIGLGPGVTPSGDDILIGFLAGLWSIAGGDQSQLAFLHSFGAKLVHAARQTSEISRTYIYHATRGQFSSSLTRLAAAIETGNAVEEAAQAAMRIGHSSGMDSVTGLLIGLCIWNPKAPIIPTLSLAEK